MSCRVIGLCVLVCLIVSVGLTTGFCPSNGNTRALYITTNNGDNILSYDSSGTYLGEVLNMASFPPDVEIHKLRSMHFGPGGYLYVASAKGLFSRIFAVSGNGVINHTVEENCARNYEFTVVKQSPSNPFLDHPYDFEFHPETGALFVANQNSVTVTKYTMPPEKRNSSAPTWTPEENNKFALGNAVDENGGKVAIPASSGLFVSSWSSSYLLTSVRGIALSPLLPRALVNGTAGPGLYTRDSLTMGYYLLVCDVAADMVHVFDAETGEHLYGVDIPSPIQVRFPSTLFSTANSVFDTAGNQIMKVDIPYIYVTSKENGMAYFVHLTPHTTAVPIGNNPYSPNVKPHTRRAYSITPGVPFHAASGILEHPTLNVVLVADRTGRRVDSYASPLTTNYMAKKGPSPKVATVVRQLPDQPEFMMYALLETQANIPFCYELSPTGSLRYAALCSAGILWFTLFLLVVAFVGVMMVYSLARRLNAPKARRMGAKVASMESMPLLSQGGVSYGASKHKTE